MLATTFLALSSCRVANQKPTDIFADRTDLPKSLDTLANPKPTHAPGAGLPSRVSVAVIDNGVDYTHPDLVRQIRFDAGMKGAGLDVMGDDRWPHPNLIDASLFSFGARGVQDGLIRGAPEHPLNLILKANEDFLRTFLPIHRADTRLANTLFRRINESNFSLFMATNFLRYWDADEYADLKKLGRLITEGSPPSPEASLETQYNWRRLAELPWTGDLSYEFRTVEGAEFFAENIEKAYKGFDAATGYSAKLEPMRAFYKARNSAHENRDLESSLSSAFNAVTNRYPRYSPEVQLSETLCGIYSPDLYRRIVDPQTNATVKFDLVRKGFDEQIRIFGEFLDVYEKLHADQPDDVAGVRDTRIAMGFLPKYFANVVSPAERTLFFCDSKEPRRQPDPKIVRFAKERGHPFFDRASAEEVHGTHVAGIIARQSPKNQIVPIRIITASSESIPLRDKQVRAELEKGFSEWIDAYPSALLAAQKRLGVSGRGAVLAKFREYLNEFWGRHRLDFYFFNEMMESIRYVGAQRIKLANMSLGTTFEQEVDSPNPPTARERLNTDGTFVVYEYFKTRVAQEVRSNAPHTLFVIASGNDAKWVDGRTRSALPCDLTSSYLAQFEQDAGAKKVVNNDGFRNVLCVGSMNSRDELSSFMNLPVTETPFVLSYGEAILAPVKQTSCGFAETSLQKENGMGSTFSIATPIFDFEGFENGKYDAFLKKNGFLSGRERPSELKKTRSWFNETYLSMIRGALQSTMRAEYYRRCFENPVSPKDHLSGTSMATPAVAGYIGRILSTYLRLAKIEEEQAYDDPRFSPENIIKHLQDKSPAFGGSSIIKDVRKVSDIRSWSTRLKPAELEERLATPVIDVRAGRSFQGDAKAFETFIDGAGI